MKTRLLNKENVVTSVPLSRLHVHCCLGLFGGHPVFRSWVHGLGHYWSLDWAMTNALPILTASVLYLGVCPTLRFNEPQVSQGARSSAPAKPHLPLPLPFLIPESSGTLPYPGCPSPDAPWGARGLRNRGCCTSESYCSTIWFCPHLVGRRQERSERLMRRCERGLQRAGAGLVTGS